MYLLDWLYLCICYPAKKYYAVKREMRLPSICCSTIINTTNHTACIGFTKKSKNADEFWKAIFFREMQFVEMQENYTLQRWSKKDIISSTWSTISRLERAPVYSKIRSAKVDFPWSICAIIQKLRIGCLWGCNTGSRCCAGDWSADPGQCVSGLGEWLGNYSCHQQNRFAQCRARTGAYLLHF